MSFLCLETMACEESMDGEALLRLSRLGGLLGEQALATLLQRNYPWIRARCMQILRNQADADDAAQEVVLKVYQYLPQFEGRSSLRTWIGRIAYNECISLIRRRSRNVVSDHIAELIRIHEHVLRPATGLEDINYKQILREVETLQPGVRDVIQLRFFGDHSLEDISSMLGLSLSATKMRLYRGLEKLAANLEIDAGSPESTRNVVSL